MKHLISPTLALLIILVGGACTVYKSSDRDSFNSQRLQQLGKNSITRGRI